MSSFTFFQAKRMYSGPIDVDIVFTTKTAMDNHRLAGTSYAGMIVACLEDNSVYLLNKG
jgi:hypothetical protein